MSTSQAEFSAYYREHYPVVARYIERRLDDTETARELAADVFRVVWQKQRALPQRSWLMVTARNLLGNEYRRRGRQRALVERAAANVPVAASGDTDLVNALLDGLDEKHREVLRLAYWDELSGAEMAALLGCSVNAVWLRLSRARAAAQAVLERLDTQGES